jgi:hypothetical protein
MKKLLFLAPALAALTLSACGASSSSDTTGATGTVASTGQRGAFMNDEVRACLQQQGVQLPDRPQGGQGDGGPPAGGLPGGTGGQPPQGYGPPGGGGGGMSDSERQKFQDALKKCGVDFGDRAGGGFGRPDTSNADYRARVKAYVACVRQNGFDLPDPNFSGDGPIFDPQKVDQSDKTFQAASAKCQDKLRPQASSSSSPTSTTTS